jgi:hypothetical protein
MGKMALNLKILLFLGMTFFRPEGQNHQKWLTCRFWALEKDLSFRPKSD